MYMKPGGRQFLVLVQLPRGALPSSLSMYMCVCVCFLNHLKVIACIMFLYSKALQYLLH